MKIDKTRLTKRPKKSFKKWVIGALGIVWILSTILAYKALKQPLKVEQRNVENRIIENTTFNYKVEVEKSTLFPKGGIVEPEETMFTSITKAIHLNINSNITSDGPVTVQGIKRVYIKLVAEGLWERQFILDPEKKFNLQGNENKLVDNDYAVDIKEIAEYIEDVEKEIIVRPDKYLLTIKPEFEGNIIYNGNEFPIDSAPEFSFEFSNQIKQIGESEFTIEKPIETIMSISQDFKLLNISIPLMTARLMFSIISLALLGLVSLGIYRPFKLNDADESAADRIDKRYKNRLINIERNILVSNKINVNIKSFKSLIQLADDKEQPVLRYKNSDIGRVYYYVIDGDCVYSYSANDKGENLSLMEVSVSASENNIKQGQ